MITTLQVCTVADLRHRCRNFKFRPLVSLTRMLQNRYHQPLQVCRAAVDLAIADGYLDDNEIPTYYGLRLIEDLS